MTVTPQQIQDWDMARVGADVELTDSFDIEFDRPALTQRGQQSGIDDKNISCGEKPELSNEASCETDAANRVEKAGKLNKETGSVTSDKSGNPEAQNVKTTEEEWRPISELQQQANVCQAKTRLDDDRTDLAYHLQEAANDFVEQSKWDKENDRSKTQDAATPGVYGKKKFCTHWIRTGNCDYMQEGCRYLHVIPDAETRLRIGIRDMPRWAKEDLPSPPQETHHARRRSWSPTKEKRDSHKDWRYRGNRRTHAELPAGPPLFSRPSPLRPSTPTSQIAVHGKQYGQQRGTIEMQSTHPVGNNQAAQIAKHNNQENAISQPVQCRPFPAHHHMSSSQPISSATAAPQLPTEQMNHHGFTTQGSFAHQQQFTPLLSSSTPLHIQSPQTSSGLRGGHSPLNHGGYSHGSSYNNGNHDAFCSQQSPTAIQFDAGDGRMDGSRWGYPSHQPQGMHAQQFMQSRLTPAPRSPMVNPWLRGHFPSPTPSFSEASVGTIGHGRPGNSDHNLSSPMAGSPILHKRFFRQPGESQYVQAQSEPKAKPKNSNGHNSHEGKGMTTFAAQEGDGGRSGELGNLIALDE